MPEPASIALFQGVPASDELRRVLKDAGYDIVDLGLPGPWPRLSASVVIIDGGLQTEQAQSCCARVRAEQQDAFTPILFITCAEAAARHAGLEHGADAVLARPFQPAELVSQVRALARIKERHDQLAARVAEAQLVSQRLQETTRKVDQELEFARRLQESFLPQSMPQVPKVRFAVKYKPFAQVGGDFYDIFRLDEKHLGFYIADAMGHGVPASLLTIFVKKGVRAKEITGKSYRLVPPPEVLSKLNHDLIDQQIPDLPFITMIYVLFNYVDGTLQFSRAGHPYPLYLPKEGGSALWQIDGSLLGVFETQYHLQSHQLKAGDKLVLYTDGMDGASFEKHPTGLASLLAGAERFRSLPIDEMVERLASDLFTQTRCNDDLTVFGMEIQE